MKRAILIVMLLCGLQAAPVADAGEAGVNLLLTGGPEADQITVRLSSDGRSYLIEAQGPLEIGAAVCTHPEGREEWLLCEAKAVTGFEVNAGGGNDSITISRRVTVPVTLRGGPGDDRLRGGGGNDKLIGGSGNDKLIGEGGEDWLYGGPGDDFLYGGPGADKLVGGPGDDAMVGGPGHNTINGGSGHNVTIGRSGHSAVNGGAGGSRHAPSHP
jgi:Ca2+-binding RTX toxin-like protein